MKYIYSILAFFTFLSCQETQTFDKQALALELDSIYQIDQKHRIEMQNVEWNSPEYSDLIIKMNAVDLSNQTRIIEIIDMVGGYPGKSLVGDDASKATFYVLQHSTDSIQEKYFELILEAAKNNELNKRLAAMYQDRYLMRKGENQIYGTQIRMESYTDNQTGEKIDTTYVWPIADTTNIDSLRRVIEMGPLEEYLNKFELSRWE